MRMDIAFIACHTFQLCVFRGKYNLLVISGGSSNNDKTSGTWAISQSLN